MAKKKKKAAPKKKAKKKGTTLAVKGSFLDVIKAAVKKK